MVRPSVRVIAIALTSSLLLPCLMHPARAADPCGTSAFPASCDPAPFTKFYTVRVGLPFNSLTYRDLEFPWD